MPSDAEKRQLRVTDVTRLQELHDAIAQLINEAQITAYEAIGVLEAVKQDILYWGQEEDG